MLLAVLRQLGEGILLVGIDADERHALLGEPLGQLHQSRSIERCQRALGSQEGNHHGSLVGKVGQRMRFAGGISQREVVDLPAEGRILFGGVIGLNRLGDSDGEDTQGEKSE